MKNSTSARNFFRSASDPALFTNVVLARYRFSIMLPNAVPRPNFAMNALRSAFSRGLFLRMGTAKVASVRSVTVSWTVMFVNTFFQNAAM